jgi:Pyridoxamine 5'-phosphate oxidase
MGTAVAEGSGTPLDGEVDAFLKDNWRTFMITKRKDGSPTAHPMSRYYGEGRLLLNMYAKSVKHRNLERDSLVTCLVTTPSDAEEFRAVVYRGGARMLTIEETLADDAPQAVRMARIGSAEEAQRTRGDTSHPADEGFDDPRMRADVITDRIARRIRVVWEVVPEQTRFLEQVSGEEA